MIQICSADGVQMGVIYFVVPFVAIPFAVNALEEILMHKKLKK